MTASMSSSAMIVRIRAYWFAPWMSETSRRRDETGSSTLPATYFCWSACVTARRLRK